MIEETSELVFPFDKNMQKAIMGYMLRDPNFFLHCKSIIKPDWFNEERPAGLIYDMMLKLHKEFTQPPRHEEIISSKYMLRENKAEQERLKNAIGMYTLSTANYSFEYIKGRVNDWLIAVTLKQGLQKAEKLYNAAEFDRCRELFVNINKDIGEVRNTSIPITNWDNIENFFIKEEELRKDALTTGLRALDTALLAGAEGGGLKRGEMTLLIAATGAGKTTTAITMACHNIRLGKHVLFMTHEDTAENLVWKIVCSMLQVTYHEFRNAVVFGKDPKLLGRINVAKQFLKRFLTHVHYNDVAKPVEDVADVIEQLQAQKKLEREKESDHGYDLLVSDYPAKLSCRNAKDSSLREVQHKVYDTYVQLASKHKFHALTIIQTNREGSKVNNGKEDRLLTKEDTSEAFGPAMVAHNIITLNRTAAAKKRNRLTFYVDKTRGQEVGTAVVCRSAFERFTTHSEELGCVHYNGTSSLEDKIDEILAQSQGITCELPDSLKQSYGVK
jgi:KaiC/GvpD/RAD55 family RecA-like ATPase